MRPSDDVNDAGCYPLQRLLVPMPGMPETLYLGPGSRFAPGPAEALHLPVAGRLEGDTYFNAFFLEFWRVRAGVRRIGVTCRATGTVQIRVTGHLPGGGARVLARWVAAAVEGASLRWIWDAGQEPDLVRLSLTVDARDGAEVEEIAFVTDRAPARPVRLAVGLVTHDREVLFRQTVRALADLGAEMPELHRVHVINHGRGFQDEALRDLLQGPLFHVVNQPNLGGCGGFSRAMVETLEGADGVTHLLLMDDDIVLDPRIVRRAAAFAAHAAADVAVGGQAIELERPTRLQEAWGRLDSNWLPRMEGADLDLTAGRALTLWDRCPDVHYNGWWFCMIPLRAIRRCGLPTPIFIRGDDIEYGLRLRAAGVPTVPLPGLGVWHASVRYKHVGLVQYYDLRNGLITAATHPELAPFPDAMRVLGWALHHLLVHRYRAATASLMAVADFLDGPEAALGPNGAERHSRLSDAIGRLPQPARRGGIDPAAFRRPAAFDAARSVPINTTVAVWLILRILLRPRPGRIGLLQIGAPDPRLLRGEAYLLALEPEGRRCMEIVPRKWLFLRLVLWALWLGLRHGVMRRRAIQRWRDRLPFLQSRTNWAREFAVEREAG